MALTIPPYLIWIVVVLPLALPVLSPASENPRPNPLVENVPDYLTRGRLLIFRISAWHKTSPTAEEYARSRSPGTLHQLRPATHSRADNKFMPRPAYIRPNPAHRCGDCAGKNRNRQNSKRQANRESCGNRVFPPGNRSRAASPPDARTWIVRRP